MNDSLDMFDSAEGERLKREGMQLAAKSRPDQLAAARKIAKYLCVRDGSTNADEVLRLMAERYGIKTLGNAAGSLFTGGGFAWTGEFVKSERKHAHSNLLRVWRLR